MNNKMGIRSPDVNPPLNCINYAYQKIGLSSEGEYVLTLTVSDLLENMDEVGPEDADVVVVVPQSDERVLHIALLDKNKPGFVDHCPKVGAEPCVVPIEEALAEYEGDNVNSFLYFKMKEDKENTV